MANRGEFKGAKRASQLIKFEGMRWNNITPTDIDLAIEARGAYVFGEFKLEGKSLELGQRLALENIAKDIKPSPCLMFVAEHKTNWQESIIAKECNVVECRWNGRLLTEIQLSKINNVKHVVDAFLFKTRGLQPTYSCDSNYGIETGFLGKTHPQYQTNEEWLSNYEAAEAAA